MDFAEAFSLNHTVALLEFEQKCKDPSLSAKERVAPLIAYIEKYAHYDKENIWRLYLLISQSYHEKNQYKEAITYSELSKKNAPSSMQSTVTTYLNHLKNNE